MKGRQIIHQDAGFVDTRDDSEPQNSSTDLTFGSTRPPIGLGDWVETWAKPIGCVIDRCTAKFPEWLVAARPFKGARLVRPQPKPKRWSWAWLAAMISATLKRCSGLIARATANWPVWATKSRYLPHSLRTGFCKGTCGCNKRRQFLNRLVSDVRHPFARLQARF